MRQLAPALVMASRQRKSVPVRIPTDWTGIIFALVLSAAVILPLLVVGVWAFTEVWRYPNVIPQQFGLRFWNQTLTRADVWSALTLSLQLSTVVTLLSAAICLPAAYAFARLSFPGRNVLFFSFLAGHAFPKFGLLIAIAAIFLQLNLIGTFWGVVLIQLVGTLLFMIWIPVAAFQSVDRRMEEAARDVGAGPFRVFWSIVLPMARPALITIVILSFQGSWNELSHFIVATQSPELTVLTKGVASLASGQLSQGTQYPLKLAAAAIMTIPVAVLFFIFQRRIMNTSEGAVKG